MRSEVVVTAVESPLSVVRLNAGTVDRALADSASAEDIRELLRHLDEIVEAEDRLNKVEPEGERAQLLGHMDSDIVKLGCKRD